jgi:hypothetical protein
MMNKRFIMFFTIIIVVVCSVVLTTVADTPLLFTNKAKYREGEIIKVTFINKDLRGRTAIGGYCLEIYHRAPGTTSTVFIPVPCIASLAITPVGGNITWQLTAEQLVGPGDYTLIYNFTHQNQKNSVETTFKMIAADAPVNYARIF